MSCPAIKQEGFMENEVLRAIAQRRSHRAYDARQISCKQLDALMEAALSAPSANNFQPWHYTVVQDQGLLNRVHRAAEAAAMLRDREDRSPRYDNKGFQIFYHAPTVFFISAPESRSYAPIDCGIAAQTLALAAQSMGLGSVILGMPRDAFTGREGKALEKLLRFPEGYSFVIAVAIGYPTDDKPAHERKPGTITILTEKENQEA